MGQSSL